MGAPDLWWYGQTDDKEGIKRGQSVTNQWTKEDYTED